MTSRICRADTIWFTFPQWLDLVLQQPTLLSSLGKNLVPNHALLDRLWTKQFGRGPGLNLLLSVDSTAGLPIFITIAQQYSRPSWNSSLLLPQTMPNRHSKGLFQFQKSGLHATWLLKFENCQHVETRQQWQMYTNIIFCTTWKTSFLPKALQVAILLFCVLRPGMFN